MFFSCFLSVDKAFWLSQILCLFPIVSVLCGWLVVIHMKQPRVFPEDKIEHCEKCKWQSKLIRSWMDLLCILNSCISSEKWCGDFWSASSTQYARKRSLILFSFCSYGLETLVLVFPHINRSCQLEEQGLVPKQALDTCPSGCQVPVSVGFALKSSAESRFWIAVDFITRQLFNS